MDANTLITNEAGTFGILLIVLGLIFYTSQSNNIILKSFYKYVPSLLLCYFVPGILNSLNIIDAQSTNIYYIASRYLLPACLVLLTLSVDLKSILNLGPKALIMFLAGTFGIILGGPFALFIVSQLLGDFEGLSLQELARGMTTVAGSWIGGGANQASMKEIFNVPDKVFSIMIVVDVLISNLWMAILIVLSAKSHSIDQNNSADTSSMKKLINKMEKFSKENSKVITTDSLIYLSSIAFGVTGFAHIVSSTIAPYITVNYPQLIRFSFGSSFFWLIIISTTFGLVLSFTPLKKLEGLGASKVANVFLYILISSIGMQMDIFAIFSNLEALFIGIIWMSFHAFILIIVGKVIKAPLFYLAVGSQANVGGAASAPIVASLFHPSLASVGVLLAVLGYVLGTYGAWICGQLMMMLAA